MRTIATLLGVITLGIGTTATNATTSAVFDGHIHTFNYRYIPVEGILLSRGVPRAVAVPLAKLFIAATDTDSTRRSGRPPFPERGVRARDYRDFILERLRGVPAEVEALETSEEQLDDYLQDVLDTGLETQGQKANVARSATSDTPETRMANFLVYAEREFTSANTLNEFMKSGPTQSETSSKAGIQQLPLDIKASAVMVGALESQPQPAGYLHLVALLFLSPYDLVDGAFYHQSGVYAEILSVMMDLEHVYADEPSIDYRTQHDHLALVKALYGTKFHFLTAYDPFRKDPNFTLVKDGFQKGAIGAKFYPPSGYRPIDTVIPPKPDRCFFVRLFLGDGPLARQWESRYADLQDEDTRLAWKGKLRDEDGNLVDLLAVDDKRFLDLMNLAFYRFVQREQKLIFSHHTTRGFEAQPGYGQLFGSPCYWHRVLQIPELSTMRLILGHSGGEDGWYSDPGTREGQSQWDSSFARKAYELCVRYPNVYCDFGFHGDVLEEGKRENFRQRLLAIKRAERKHNGVSEFRKVEFCEEKATGLGQGPYSFFDKMIYGSDWTMVAQLGETEFVQAFEDVFSGELAPYRDEFFRKNAQRVLRRAKVE